MQMLPMPETLGRSVYLNDMTDVMPAAVSAAGVPPVFISLHVKEEFDRDFTVRAVKLINELNEKGYRVLADVSKETLEQFKENDISVLAQRLGLWGVRIDYGFSLSEICDIASVIPTVVNASTVNEKDAGIIASSGKCIMAMHNFYPRPETGLDEDYLHESTEMLHAAGFKVIAFISGDMKKRGPIFEGLPTVENYRKLMPYEAYLNLILKDGVDQVFVGDPEISSKELNRINRFIGDQVVEAPCILKEKYQDLYGREYTCRVDSPGRLIRFQESRGFGYQDETEIRPENNTCRIKGSITIDNSNYSRYCGELQIIREDLPCDKRVNVIGNVKPEYIEVIDRITRGKRFRLVVE